MTGSSERVFYKITELGISCKTSSTKSPSGDGDRNQQLGGTATAHYGLTMVFNAKITDVVEGTSRSPADGHYDERKLRQPEDKNGGGNETSV